MVVILESIADNLNVSTDADVLTEYVRTALSNTITNQYKINDQPLKVITLNPSMEDHIAQSLKNTPDYYQPIALILIIFPVLNFHQVPNYRYLQILKVD